jgi:tetratricopeptide (TPR) repeat protein
VGRSEAITKPFDTSSLMAAIEEEQPFSGNEGAQQLLDAVVRKRVAEETLIVVRREQRKSRAVMLFVLFLVVVGEYFALRWFEENGHRNELAPSAGLAEPARKPAPEVVPPAEGVGDPAAAAAAAAAPAAEAPPAANVEQAAKPAAEAAKPSEEPAQPAKPAAEVAKPPVEVAKQEPATAPAPEPEPAAAQAQAPVAEGAGPAPGASSDSLVHDGSDLLSKGNAALAKTYFVQATQSDAKNAHAFAGLAEAELALGEHRDALQSIEQAIKLRPKRARYRVTQGDILKALGKQDEALAAYQKGLEIDPEDREAKRRLGL